MLIIFVLSFRAGINVAETSGIGILIFIVPVLKHGVKK